MPAKKTAPARPPIECTPEMHQRACEYLADGMVALAENIARLGNECDETRRFHGLPLNPSMQVHQIAASMCLFTAKEILAGHLVVCPPPEGTK